MTLIMCRKGFLSTLSLRRATHQGFTSVLHSVFLSTLSLRRATPCGGVKVIRNGISIHALLAESDHRYYYDELNFNLFLSTLSLRRATLLDNLAKTSYYYFYPRSPCGERQQEAIETFKRGWISIHALLAESDNPPIRSCTAFAAISIHALLAESDYYNCFVESIADIISIHALLAESDPAPSRRKTTDMNFYPRSPCGERLFSIFDVSLVCIFLSTLSLRRAT